MKNNIKILIIILTILIISCKTIQKDKDDKIIYKEVEKNPDILTICSYLSIPSSIYYYYNNKFPVSLNDILNFYLNNKTKIEVDFSETNEDINYYIDYFNKINLTLLDSKQLKIEYEIKPLKVIYNDGSELKAIINKNKNSYIILDIPKFKKNEKGKILMDIHFESY